MGERGADLSRRNALGVMGGAAIAASAASAVAAPGDGAPRLDAKLDIDGYKPTDTFFDKVYVDVDEQRTDYVPHRYIHGGFKGTATRFTLHFPEAGKVESRFLQPLQGGLGGSEFAYGSPQQGVVNSAGGLDTAVRLGAYLVQSNQGHIGTEQCPKAKEDVSIYGYRASAEVARFARHLARQIYGTAPKYGYVFGGSGGGHRTHLCLEGAPDVWAGALPYMSDSQVDPAAVNAPMISSQVILYSCLVNTVRVLGDRLKDVVDATAPGGSGRPFANLNSEQREALADLYRCGFPRGAEFLLDPVQYNGQISEWAWVAELIKRRDPGYIEAFWKEPGHAGHDSPERYADQLIDATVTVKRVITAADLAAHVAKGGPAAETAVAGGARGLDKDLAVALVFETVPKGYMTGAGFALQDGAARGRTLYCTGQVDGMYVGAALDEPGNLRFSGVKPGDKVRITNREFLAYCHWYRHHVIAGDLAFDGQMVDGRPLWPQRQFQKPAAIFSGGRNTAKFAGKMLWYHNTHDAAVWPATAFYYANAVRRVQGEDGMKERYRLRFNQNAQHASATRTPRGAAPVMNTRVIDYTPAIEQGLHDLVAWVEKGIAPAGTNAEYRAGQLVLPATAATRGGIQPVVNASANGATRAEVKVGQPVTLSVEGEVPPGAGSVIAVEWDFDGEGKWPFQHPGIDGTSTRVALETRHSFDKPGTYFPCVRVVSHREGDVKATSRRIENIARVRVVVT